MLASSSIQAAPRQACLWLQREPRMVAHVYFMHAKDDIYTFILLIVSFCACDRVLSGSKSRERESNGGEVCALGRSNFPVDFAASLAEHQ